MEFVTGALGTLIPKLTQLLHAEYKLQKGVRKDIEFLTKELELTNVALCSIGEVPLEQLPEQVKIWARDARALSYNMEDVVDTFLVRVEGPNRPNRRSSRKFIQKMKSLLAVGTFMVRHQIGQQIKDIKERVNELAERRDRSKVDTINPVVTLDPRIGNLYTKAADLVGIENSREELVTKLTEGDDMSIKQQRIVSIVGFGGLGKTTLAKAVCDEIKSQFDCAAFVTVSRTPDMKKFLKDMLYELDKMEYGDIHNRSLDENQLIDIIRGFLHDKRYLVIIDDIWNTSHWDTVIKYALPDSNNGCRIIATTRIISVANHIGHAYEMQPLSLSNSRVLLYRRIFFMEDTEKFLDEKLAEVSDRILKKCAGVPLAIITIASLLAGKGINKTEWEDVCNSIGNGMESSLDAENMRKILSYSYYDLPSHLRTCLLYLCIFPEDFTIGKERLIWLWIGEGFIQPKKQWKKGLFELGETYFDELVNRSMIQPNFDYTEIISCCMHDVVLDLICSISAEENFVTVMTKTDQALPSTVVRRLSLQSGMTKHAMTQATHRMTCVRSAIVFPALRQMLALQNFKVLRVLDLQGYNLSRGYSLHYLGSLLHLRYLNLGGTGIEQLPEAVGKLKYLEILNVRGTKIRQLPKCVAQLTCLLRLSVGPRTRISNWIGSLTFLEHLGYLRIDDEWTDNLHGLDLLTELRELSISLSTDKCPIKMVESLYKLRKIQVLGIYMSPKFRYHPSFLGRLDAWVPPPKIRKLYAEDAFWFSTLPIWLKNSTEYHDLGELHIFVRELQQEDIENLGKLPALSILTLMVDHKNLRIFGPTFVTGAGQFPCLKCCRLWGFEWPFIFQQGAMPRLMELNLDCYLPEATGIVGIVGSDGGFDCNLENLQSLKIVSVFIAGRTSEEQAKAVKAALRRAAEGHSNQLEVFIDGLLLKAIQRRT